MSIDKLISVKNDLFFKKPCIKQFYLQFNCHFDITGPPGKSRFLPPRPTDFSPQHSP